MEIKDFDKTFQEIKNNLLPKKKEKYVFNIKPLNPILLDAFIDGHFKYVICGGDPIVLNEDQAYIYINLNGIITEFGGLIKNELYNEARSIIIALRLCKNMSDEILYIDNEKIAMKDFTLFFSRNDIIRTEKNSNQNQIIYDAINFANKEIARVRA